MSLNKGCNLKVGDKVVLTEGVHEGEPAYVKGFRSANEVVIVKTEPVRKGGTDTYPPSVSCEVSPGKI